LSTIQPKVVVAFTGAFGSGCTTGTKHLRDTKKFRYVLLSQTLRDHWQDQNPGKEPDRLDLQRLGDKLRAERGNGALVDLALESIETDGEADLVERLVLDGVRNLGEVDRLKDLFGYKFTLVAVLASIDARWDRIGRTAYTDRGLGRRNFVEDDLRDADEEISSGQQVIPCLDKADILIDNSEAVTLAKYLEKLTSFIELLSGERPRQATQSEILMNMAFSSSHSSKCLKRHVGAIIVDRGGQLISVGYNENPLATKPCMEEPTYGFKCYRDIVRNNHFSSLVAKGAKCPECGEAFQAMQGPPWRCSACTKKDIKTNLEKYFFPDRAMSLCTAIHAEVWAILSAGERARGGTLYTTTFPCFQCAEKITQVGVKAVFYTEAYPDPLSRDRLLLAEIELHQFEGVRSASFEKIFSATRPA
jgi:deoxycytidylate deaminase/dephospho-CoA kinase